MGASGGDRAESGHISMMNSRLLTPGEHEDSGKEIKTYSKSARLLTTHPSDSYTIVKDASGQCELKITNSAKFWSVSKYLVVQVR